MTATMVAPTEVEEVSPVKAIKAFFGLSAKDAVVEIKKLSHEDREQLSTGIKDGSLTY